MRLLSLPWLLLLVTGIGGMLVARDALGFVTGVVMAPSGLVGRVVVARHYRR